MDYDILIITETKTRKNDKLYFREYNTINMSRERGEIAAGGIAIVIRNGIKFDQIQVKGYNPDEVECAGIKTKIPNRDLLIIGVYRRPGRRVRQGTWRNIIKKNRTNDKEEMILAGDFNSHSILWN